MSAETFIDTRMQLHWAAQAVAGVGRCLVAPREDDSHSNLGWSRPHRALTSNAVEDGRRGAVRFRDLTLLVVRDRGLIDDEFPLDGKTIDDAFAFFERVFGATVRRPNMDEALPSPPPERFSLRSDDLARLDRLYDDADVVLQAFRAKHDSSEVRCWPHHFDIATLKVLGEGRTLGAGFLAGDAENPEPYWYVTPYPYPEDRATFAPLPIGEWHREPWFGAVLRGDRTRDEAAGFLEVVSNTLLR